MIWKVAFKISFAIGFVLFVLTAASSHLIFTSLDVYLEIEKTSNIDQSLAEISESLRDLGKKNSNVSESLKSEFYAIQEVRKKLSERELLNEILEKSVPGYFVFLMIVGIGLSFLVSFPVSWSIVNNVKVLQKGVTQGQIAKRELESLLGWKQTSKVLAHELKNALTPLQLWSSNIEDAEQKQTILQQIKHLRTLVKSFGEFGKIPDPNLESRNLGSYLQEFCSAHHGYAQLDLVPINESMFVQMDKLQIDQVLLNLVKNAIEAGDQNIVIKIEPRLEGKFVTVEISNDGEIHPKMMESLFLPQVSSKGDGRGLGLVVCKLIMLMHKGTIEARRESGRIYFTLRFPMSKEAV